MSVERIIRDKIVHRLNRIDNSISKCDTKTTQSVATYGSGDISGQSVSGLGGTSLYEIKVENGTDSQLQFTGDLSGETIEGGGTSTFTFRKPTKVDYGYTFDASGSSGGDVTITTTEKFDI